MKRLALTIGLFMPNVADAVAFYTDRVGLSHIGD